MRTALSGRRYNEVRRQGISSANGPVRVWVLPNGSSKLRFGLETKKVKGSVVRNRLRRRLRAAFEPLRSEASGFDVILRSNTGDVALEFPELQRALSAAFHGAIQKFQSGDAAGRTRHGTAQNSGSQSAPPAEPRPIVQ